MSNEYMTYVRTLQSPSSHPSLPCVFYPDLCVSCQSVSVCESVFFLGAALAGPPLVCSPPHLHSCDLSPHHPRQSTAIRWTVRCFMWVICLQLTTSLDLRVFVYPLRLFSTLFQITLFIFLLVDQRGDLSAVHHQTLETLVIKSACPALSPVQVNHLKTKIVKIIVLFPITLSLSLSFSIWVPSVSVNYNNTRVLIYNILVYSNKNNLCVNVYKCVKGTTLYMNTSPRTCGSPHEWNCQKCMCAYMHACVLLTALIPLALSRSRILSSSHGDSKEGPMERLCVGRGLKLVSDFLSYRLTFKCHLHSSVLVCVCVRSFFVCVFVCVCVLSPDFRTTSCNVYTHIHTETHTVQKPQDMIPPLYVTSEAGHNLTWQVMTETLTWYHIILAGRPLTETAQMHSILNGWGYMHYAVYLTVMYGDFCIEQSSIVPHHIALYGNVFYCAW